MTGPEIEEAIQGFGARLALLIAQGRHDEVKHAAQVMVAQGELILGMYQQDMSMEELEGYRQRLEELR